VIARQDLFDRLKAETEVFSTFGGDPVASSAALAVLDVIEDERLIESAKRMGDELMEALRGLEVGEVRGSGLLVGVELEGPQHVEDAREPHARRWHPHQAHGPRGTVLKIRARAGRTFRAASTSSSRGIG
jgi:4-aminobutyrate aminotransferase-like enzyme